MGAARLVSDCGLTARSFSRVALIGGGAGGRDDVDFCGSGASLSSSEAGFLPGFAAGMDAGDGWGLNLWGSSQGLPCGLAAIS